MRDKDIQEYLEKVKSGKIICNICNEAVQYAGVLGCFCGCKTNPKVIEKMFEHQKCPTCGQMRF